MSDVPIEACERVYFVLYIGRMAYLLETHYSTLAVLKDMTLSVGMSKRTMRRPECLKSLHRQIDNAILFASFSPNDYFDQLQD